MIKNFQKFLLLLILPFCLWAQQKELPLSDVVKIRKGEVAPKIPEQISWLPEGNQFAYLLGNKMVLEAVEKTEKITEIDLSDLNTWLQNAQLDTLGKYPKIHWINDEKFGFLHNDQQIQADWQKKKVSVYSEFQGTHKNEDIADKTLTTAFTRERNLFLLKKGGKEVAINSASEADVWYGASSHRREFGIRKGTFWSPSGKLLAFYRKDESMVTDYPYMDYSERPAVAKPKKYPMAGMNNHLVTIGVYQVKSGKTVWLKTGEPADQYFTNLTWSPDEKHLYSAHINRDQTRLRMVQYDVKSGKPIRTVFQEEEAKYLDPQVGPYFINDDPKQFLWLSRRDGWNHFYLYDREGNFIKQLTKGEWEVVKHKGFDKAGTHVFFTATKESPLNRDLYRVGLESGAIERLTIGNGTHKVAPSPDSDYFIDTFSNLRTPGVTALYDMSGKKLRDLQVASNPLQGYRIGETKITEIKAENGEQLFMRTIFPPNFNTNEQYPLLVYVYGGPHSQQVRNSWLGGGGSWGLWLNYMATQGVVVMTVDNRGTNYRGKAFEQATFRKLGTIEIEDQLTAVAELTTQGFIDTTKIGVIGWSYGGFMATSLMLRAPNVFTAGISGAPVIDWQYYETVYTERYMDTPESNPDGYRESSALNYLGQLKGNLLMIHGTSDDIVMWQHSVLFMEAAMKAGKHVEYMIYPGHKHGIRGKDRLHLFTLFSDRFKQYFQIEN